MNWIKKHPIWTTVIVGVGVLGTLFAALLIVATLSVLNDTSTAVDSASSDQVEGAEPEPEPEPEAEAAPEEVEPEPAPAPPKHRIVPKDFLMKLKVRQRQCFGSAGCNVTYQINPIYKRDLSELKGKSLDVTYKVLGDESGPIINTFQLDGTQMSFDEEEYASTPSSGTKLSAVVTRVEAQ